MAFCGDYLGGVVWKAQGKDKAHFIVQMIRLTHFAWSVLVCLVDNLVSGRESCIVLWTKSKLLA